jgi:hypothetical protein
MIQLLLVAAAASDAKAKVVQLPQQNVALSQ